MFGENGRMHSPSYFDDILSIREISACQIRNQNLIEILTNEISNGNYLALNCNYPRLFTDKPNFFNIHEAYLFGFDKKKEIFYGTALQKSGRFEEIEFSFSYVQAAFDEATCYFIEHPEELVERQCFFFHISSIRLKDAYQNDNSVYLFLQKLRDELHGSKRTARFYCQDGQLPAESAFFYSEEGKIAEVGEYYTGLACLLLLREDINKLVNDKNILEVSAHNLTKSLKKLHEHQSIIQMSMEWFMRELSIQDVNLHHLVQEYKEYCATMQQTYLMALKFEMNRDTAMLQRIQDELFRLYQKEYAYLSEFEPLARQHYCEHQRQQLR